MTIVSNGIDEGFYKLILFEDEFIENIIERDSIFFILKGYIQMTYKRRTVKVEEKSMVFIPRKGYVKFYAHETECHILMAKFDRLVSPYDKLYMAQLFKLKDKHKFKFSPQEIKPRLLYFINGMHSYTEMGINCGQLHKIKLLEMFWLLRYLYSDTEMVNFFFFLLSAKRKEDIRLIVLDNWKKTRNIKELAALSNLSISTFRRHFYQEFGESIGSWIDRNLRETIIQYLSERDLPINIIAEDLNFSSPSHFSYYCQKNFGQTPSEMRDKLLSSTTKSTASTK